MNLSLILQQKAALAFRSLVRLADGDSGLQSLRSAPPTSASGSSAAATRSPVMATRLAADGIAVLSSAALASHSARMTLAAARTPLQRSSVRPLRVLQVREKDQSRHSVGRMVISGSMADVCAELDRLVAREAALH